MKSNDKSYFGCIIYTCVHLQLVQPVKLFSQGSLCDFVKVICQMERSLYRVHYILTKTWKAGDWEQVVGVNDSGMSSRGPWPLFFLTGNWLEMESFSADFFLQYHGSFCWVRGGFPRKQIITTVFLDVRWVRKTFILCGMEAQKLHFMYYLSASSCPSMSCGTIACKGICVHFINEKIL